ncbi:MAG: response regulator transcription factor [Bacteroidota bacterium]
MKKIKIILVDDHQIVRDGIKSLLTGLDDIEIIGEAADSKELFGFIKQNVPDIIVLDISLKGLSGLEITKIISEEYPGIHVLILSMYTNEEYVYTAIKNGAKGYLPKNTTRKELVDAIHAINRGEEFFSEQISNIILKSYIRSIKGNNPQSEKPESKLTQRETEILKYFAKGVTNQEIAEKLFISIRTVESHKNHIMQKLELKTTMDLLKFAIKNKLVDL